MLSSPMRHGRQRSIRLIPVIVDQRSSLSFKDDTNLRARSQTRFLYQHHQQQHHRYEEYHRMYCRGYRLYRDDGVVLPSDRRRFFSSIATKSSQKESSVIMYDGNEDRDFEFDFNDDDDRNTENDDDDDQYEASSLQPWKSLLETPARASWRATDPRKDPPEYLKNAMYHILDEGDRTSKQLRRAHRKALSIQSNLADLREKERRTMVNGKRHFKQQQQQLNDRDDPDTDEIDDSNYYNNKRSQSSSSSSSSINPVYYGYDETLATLKHRLTPNYAITKRVLAECQSLLGGKLIHAANTSVGNNDSSSSSSSSSKINEHGQIYSKNWKPKRILDFGIGCGSASAAAIDLFGSENNGSSGIEWVHGIDPSQPMRECSKKLIEEMTRGHHNRTNLDPTATSQGLSPPTPRITFSNSLSPSSDDSSSSSSPGGGSFDLALFVYTASDLPDVSSCLAAAAMAFEKLKPNGVFVMIEPGTPDGFNSTRAVRNMLLDCCPPHDPEFEWEDRCHIIAPCTHNGTCPMERHKKNFFAHKKSIGKLGHDLPQELQDDEQLTGKIRNAGDNDSNGNDDYDPHSYDEKSDDYDQDHVEVDSRETLKMSETEAFNSSFCSFVHSVSGDSKRKGEKFSYLVAQKQRFRQPEIGANGERIDPFTVGDPFRNDNVTNLLTDALDAASFEADDLAHRTFEKAQKLNLRYVNSENDDLGLELLHGEDKRQSMGRIIRAPIKKKGHVYIDYCAAPGRIIRSRVTKALSNNAAPGLYGAARKSRWGGLWPDTMD